MDSLVTSKWKDWSLVEGQKRQTSSLKFHCWRASFGRHWQENGDVDELLIFWLNDRHAAFPLHWRWMLLCVDAVRRTSSGPRLLSGRADFVSPLLFLFYRTETKGQRAEKGISTWSTSWRSGDEASKTISTHWHRSVA